MENDNFDEHDCLRRIKQGNETAVRQLLEYFYPFVLKIVRAHLPRRTGEEDLAQIVFIKVFQKIDQYRGHMPLEHWISRIAVNTCLNALRAERIRPEWRMADFPEEAAAEISKIESADPATPYDDEIDAAKRIVAALLVQLSPADRLVITLLHLEEKSVDEVRALTGWSKSVVKVRAFRARAKMKKILNQSKALTL